MKRLNYLTVFVVLFINSPYSFAQKVRVIPFKTLQILFNKPNDTTYIVNFFASWCAPCVKELPEFVAFAEAHKNEKIQVLFVSLDFKKDLKKSLGPLSIKHNLRQNVYLLDETNANNWINQVDSTWTGDIPATLFINYKKNYNKLFNQSFTNDLLFKTVKLIAQ
jgi:thiol-disulfide isomerase/thioredoxin